MAKVKETAKQDYIEMIKQSWTWDRLTEKERNQFLELLEHPCTRVVVKGNYEQRWEACEALYHTFLEGLGYDPLEWRESQPTVSTYYELSYNRHGVATKPLNITDKHQAKSLTRAVQAESGNSNVALTKIVIKTEKMKI